MPDKISVYGATGFIGSRFCEMYDAIKIPRNQKTPETSNILYCISTTTNHNIHEDLHIDIDTNLNFLVDVLDKCRSDKIVFNFISSGFVYGQEVINAKETDSCNPRGFYSVTKLAAEQLLITFCETFNIKYRIFRLANVYGLDKNRSSKKNVLGYIVDCLRNNQSVDLYSHGTFKRDFIYVDDVCDGIYFLMNHSPINQIYNISNGYGVQFKYPVEYCKNILNSQSDINYLPIHASDYYLNIDKITSLGFKTKISLEEGLRILCSN